MKNHCFRRSPACWGLLAFFLFAPASGAPAGFSFKAGRGAGFLRKREEWFNRSRRQGVPKGTTAAALRLEALRQARLMPKVRPSALPSASLLPQAATAFGTWSFLGPQPLNSGGLAYSGRGTCVAVDLGNDPTGNTIYYGSAYGGVWKSTNALGPSPAFIPLSDQTQSLSVGAIALDSSVNPPVLYVGTGESNTSIDSYYGVGLLKSTDGGNSWTLVSSADNGAHPFLGLSFCRILVDPADSRVLVAGLRTATGVNNSTQGLNLGPLQGIYRSTDGGDTWAQVPDMAGQAIGDIAYDSTRSAYVAAADGVGYVKSTDQGQTWTVLPSPFANGTAVNSGNFQRSTLAIRGGVIYGLMQAGATLSAPSPQDTGLVQSTDGGDTWTPIAAPPGGLNDYDNQLWYNQYIGAPPGSTALVAAGNIPYMAPAVNGLGTSWIQVAGNVHSDQHAVGFVNATTWFTVNDGGIWSTTDSGSDWTDMNGTLGTLQFYSVSPDSQTAGSFAGGSQDNGTETTTASGEPAWTEAVGGDGVFTEADPAAAGRYVGEFQSGNIFLFDAETSTGIANLNGAFYTPLAVLPASPATMVAGPNDVWMGPVHPSLPGAGWRSISPAFGTHYLAPAPGNADVIYATEGSVIQKTTDATSANPAWTRISPPDGGYSLGHVAVSPADPNTVYTLVEGFVAGQKVLKSTDGGSTWTNISGNLPNAPMNWIAVDPLAPVSVYVASDVGVFLAPDGGVAGESWQNVGTGLPDTAVLQIKISNTNPRQLVAATHGRGAWDLAIGGIAPTPSITPTPTITSTPVPLSTWRVAAGRNTAYTDCRGNLWSIDEDFNAGSTNGNSNAVSGALPCASDQPLYQNERYDAAGFNYSFPVPPGTYQVTLKFAEIFDNSAGQRIENVSINGTQVLSNFDIFADAGGMDIADDKVFDNVAPVNGRIVIAFAPAASSPDPNAKVDALQIVPQAAGTATPTATPSSSPTASPTAGGGCASLAGLQLREFTSLSGNQATENFEVINAGSTPLNLSDITVKFWIDDTTGQPVAGTVDYGGCNGPNCASVSGVALSATGFSPACGPDPGHQADWELTVSDADPGTLSAGTTWSSIQTRIHLANYANFSGPSAWYSPSSVGGGSTYTNDPHYAVYYQGALVEASGGMPPACRQTACSATPSPTAVLTSTATRTPSLPPTATPTPRGTPTPSPSPTFTPTGAVGTATSTVSRTPTSTPTPTPSRTATASPTFTPSHVSTSTPTSSPTPAVTFTPTMAGSPSPTPTSGFACGTSPADLKLLEFTSCGSNQAGQAFEVVNEGTAAVTLSDLAVKFWVGDTTGQGLDGTVDYGGCAGPNCTAVSGVTLSALPFSPACGPDPNHQANWEVTLSTTSGALLGAGVTWANLQTALHLSNWSNFNDLSNWYSPCGVGGGTTYTEDLHYALYLRGNLVTASGGVPPSCRPLPTCTPVGAVPALAPAAPVPGSPATESSGFSVVAAPNVSRGGEPVRFKVALAGPARLTLSLFALTGEEVYRASTEGKGGENILAWNLGNGQGTPVASGLYLFRIEVKGVRGTLVRDGKVAVLR